MKTFAVMLSALGLALSAVPIAAQPPAPSTIADPGEANVALVKNFLTDIRGAMMSRDPARIRAVAERYMASDYVQHSTAFAPGREGYISRLAKEIGSPPPEANRPAGMPRDLVFVGNRDYVSWMSELTMADGKKHYAFNMFRIANGKFQEHWDAL